MSYSESKELIRIKEFIEETMAVILITYGILFIGELGDKSDLENACWACDALIDYSKPVKPKEEETEEIHVDKKHKIS